MANTAIRNTSPPAAKVTGETAVQKAERLLHDIDNSHDDLAALYGMQGPGTAESDKNVLINYMHDFRGVVRMQLHGETMRDKVAEQRAGYADLLDKWGGDKAPETTADPDNIGTIVKQGVHRGAGVYPSALALAKIIKAFDEIGEMMRDESISADDKKKIKAAAKALQEHYRALSKGIGKANDPRAMLDNDLEDIFRSLDMMIDTEMNISDWESKGAKGEAPWVFAGVYTDAQHRKRPIMVRAV
jgi:hypothetical protein